MTSIFGRIITGRDVRAAAKTTIQAWADTYVAEMSRQTGLTLPDLRTYTTGAGPAYPVDTLPACVIIATGTTGTPERRGDGLYDTEFELGVGVIYGDTRRDTAIDTCWAYEGALRALLIQTGSLGGFAEELTWLYSDVNQIGFDTERVIAGASIVFSARVRGVLNRWGGLPAPPDPVTTPVEAGIVTAPSATVNRLPT